MAITAVSSTELNQVGDNGAAYSQVIDIGTRTNGLLIVEIVLITTTVKTISTVTWNGVTVDLGVELARLGTAGVEHRTAIFYLANPANGSNTLTVTFGSTITTSESMSFFTSWWDGANQTQASILSTTNTGSGATDPSIAITPGEDNCLIVDLYLSEANNPLTAGGSPDTQTALQGHDFGPRVDGCSYVIQTTAGAQTMNWTGTDDQWTGVTASFKAFAAGGTTWPGWVQSSGGWT